MINVSLSGSYLSRYVWEDIPDPKTIFLSILSWVDSDSFTMLCGLNKSKQETDRS